MSPFTFQVKLKLPLLVLIKGEKRTNASIMFMTLQQLYFLHSFETPSCTVPLCSFCFLFLSKRRSENSGKANFNWNTIVQDWTRNAPHQKAHVWKDWPLSGASGRLRERSVGTKLYASRELWLQHLLLSLCYVTHDTKAYLACSPAMSFCLTENERHTKQ